MRPRAFHPNAILFLCFLVSLMTSAAASLAVAEETALLAGADMSYLALFERHGKTYRDAGVAREALAVLKAHGLNCVRLRLFTSSREQAEKDPFNRGNNLEYTLPLAQRVKRAGLQLLLDFHYSDTWADPAHQFKPSAWRDLSHDDLCRKIQEYSRETVTALREADALPDLVQVGNEITPGFLWPDGKVGGAGAAPDQWVRLAGLLRAALQGIREGAGAHPPRTIVHLDRGGDWNTTRWFLDHLREQQVEFDILGQSYYPFWHGTLADLRHCLNESAARYGKPVLVAETGFPWTGDEKRPLAGFKPGRDEQARFAAAVVEIVRQVPQGLGLGVCWWGSEYQPLPGRNLGGFENRSLFDHEGLALPALDALGKLTAR